MGSEMCIRDSPKGKASLCAVCDAEKPVEFIGAVDPAPKLVLELSFKSKGFNKGWSNQVGQAPFFVGEKRRNYYKARAY